MKFVDLDFFTCLFYKAEYLLKIKDTHFFGGVKMRNELNIDNSYLLTLISSDGSVERCENYKVANLQIPKAKTHCDNDTKHCNVAKLCRKQHREAWPARRRDTRHKTRKFARRTTSKSITLQNNQHLYRSKCSPRFPSSVLISPLSVSGFLRNMLSRARLPGYNTSILSESGLRSFIQEVAAVSSPPSVSCPHSLPRHHHTGSSPPASLSWRLFSISLLHLTLKKLKSKGFGDS